MSTMTDNELAEAIARTIETTTLAARPTYNKIWIADGRHKICASNPAHPGITVSVPIVSDRMGTRTPDTLRGETARDVRLGIEPDPGAARIDAIHRMADELLRELEETLSRAVQARIDADRETEDAHHAALNLIGVDEAARIARVHDDTIRKHVHRGTIPTPIPIAGSNAIVWQRDTIEHWALTRPRRGRSVQS